MPGPGGLPVGTGGKVVVLLSGGIDSPVAAWKIIKRGCTPIFVHFHSFPYTNKESQEKAKQIARLLAHYALRAKIYFVPFAEVQRHIMVDTPLETRVILYRRYMLRLAEQIAHREKARVLVTGDSVGQVASPPACVGWRGVSPEAVHVVYVVGAGQFSKRCGRDPQTCGS